MDPKLAIEYRELSTLKVDSSNPRKHPPRQIKKLAKAIRQNGFIVPIIVDSDGRIIAGAARYAAAERIKLNLVPVIELGHLSDAELRAYRLADNRLAEDATWDTELVRVELDYLANLEIDFDLELTGFEHPEIDSYLSISFEATEEPPPEPPAPEQVVSRLDDIWAVGRHTVGCGDARDAELVERIMGNRKARMVLTDPPYNVPISGHVCGNGSNQHPEFAMASGEMSRPEFESFLSTVLLLMLSVSAEAALHFVFMDWRNIRSLLMVGNEVYASLLNLCVWAKSNGGMGSLYRSQHELIAVFKVGTAPHINNVQLGVYGRNRTNVWSYAGVNSFGEGREEALAMHPTVKPVSMLADAILDVTHRGDVVLDSFLGSGSTLIAAERTGRVCCGTELEPRYVDVTLRRWMAATGEMPRLLGSGLPFDAVTEERLSATNAEG